MGPRGPGSGDLKSISNRASDQDIKRLIAVVEQLRKDQASLEKRIKNLESEVAELRRC